MKILLLTLLLALSSTSVMAEWVEVPGGTSATEYVNPDTIRMVGGRSKMWVLWDFKTTQGTGREKYLSLKMEFDYDCKKELSRKLVSKGYSKNMGHGSPTTFNNKPDEWTPVPPATNNEIMWKTACDML